MQAMDSITPNAIKSIRITIVITGNKTIRYKLEVDELLGELEAAIFTVVVDSTAWVVVLNVDCRLEVVTTVFTTGKE